MSQPMRILCVDDNPRNQVILRKLLSGYQLREARSGEEALEEAVRFLPDLILLDIMMPGIDGYETCRRLRAMKDLLRSPKIIIVSARAIVSERLEGYAAGADDYVTKPFDPDELQAKVAVYLRLKSMEELDRLRDHVVTLLQHETRTPLASLLGAVDLVRAYGGAALGDPQILEAIEVSATRLNDLIERVVLLSRLRSGSLRLEKVETGLDSLLESLVAGLRPLADRHGMGIEYHGAAGVVAEIDRLFGVHVVRALVENALRHSGARASVEVGLSRSDDGRQVEIVVRDAGRGMDAHRLREVQEAFVVAELDHHQHGLGLGIPIARLFVEAHGGELRLEGAPGEGLTARIRLPAGGAAEAALRPAA